MDNTIIQQGSFTGDGATVYIPLRSSVDWIAVYNLTQGAASQTTALGVKYFWQVEMGNGTSWITYKSNAASAANLEQYSTTSGFTLYDTSVQAAGNANATITAISNASIPVVTNTGTNGLVAGSVVRLTNVTGGQQLGGYDFTVGYNTLSSTTFSLDYMPQIAAATTGTWRLIPYNPIFYPRRRRITQISLGSTTVVTTSVTHGYLVGQVVRLIVPAAFGTVQLNNLKGTIIATDTSTTVNSFTLDINSSGFTSFTFPTTTAHAFTPAEVIPVGQDTATSLADGVDILSDATINDASIGVYLSGGANNPGGANNDAMVWVAGKSFANNVPAYFTA